MECVLNLFISFPIWLANANSTSRKERKEGKERTLKPKGPGGYMSDEKI